MNSSFIRRYYIIISLILKEIVCIIYVGDNMFDKLIGEAKGIFNIVTIIELIISILFIFTGLLFFTNTNYSNTLVSVITGIYLIIVGASSIYAFLKRGGIVLYNNNLIYGIILIILGILAMYLGNILSIILGIYVLVLGVQKINYGIFLKKFNESSWLITLVVGVLLIVIAVITMFTSNDAVIKVTGICLFGVGLINFVNTILLRKRSRYFIA